MMHKLILLKPRRMPPPHLSSVPLPHSKLVPRVWISSSDEISAILHVIRTLQRLNFKMAEARSGNCEANSACSKRKFGGNVVSESDDEKCKKKKFEAMNDFELVKILAEDARSKTLFLHLQSMCICHWCVNRKLKFYAIAADHHKQSSCQCCCVL